jgi:uncharacterized protein (UPF0276 family)
LGVGIGWRPEIAADLLARPGAVDHVEVVAESCLAAATRQEARALAELWPVLTHGVKLSLGSAGGVDPARARWLGDLARELRSPCVTEHVAFVRGADREIGHLTGLPHTREAVRVVARNVATARRELPDVPLLLENIAWSFRWPDDELDEGAFFHEVARETGCDLLLDVGNLYANARNSGRDPVELLESYPLDRVGMLHVAGGVSEDGFYFDTHAHAVPDAVFALVARVLEARDVPLVIERDASFPPFAELEGELSVARSLPRGARPASAARPPIVVPGDARDLARTQEELARMLTDRDAPATTGRFSAPSVARARAVLQRKRVDDALPLLPTLARCGERVQALARGVVERSPRAPALVAVADALRIADGAASERELADAARADRILLRARFSGPDREGRVRPRAGPFVGRERLAGGTRWVMKGLGEGAPVRVLEPRRVWG